MSGRFEYFTATLLQGVSNLIQRPNPFRDEYRPTHSGVSTAGSQACQMATRKGPCFEFAILFCLIALMALFGPFWPFFAPWWLLITVRRTPPFWKRVIRNCSWRLQDLSNLVLLTAARPRNQGFPRIAQYCRGQFFSTGLFFCQPGRYLEPRHIFLGKTGFIEATARFGSWWWVHLRQKILEQFDRNTTSSCDGNAY